MGVDLERFLDRADEMTRGAAASRGQPRPRARARARRGLARRAATRSASTTIRRASASGPSSSSPSRPARRARASCPRRASRPTAPTASAARCGSTIRTSSAQEFLRWEFATAVAGLVLGINPFDQPDVQAAKDRTNEVLARRRAGPSSRAARSTSCSRAPREGDYVCDPGVRRPRARGRARAARRAARARPAASSRSGLGPRYLHSTGQLHKGGPNTGLFVQVVDDVGEELAIPGSRLRLRPPDRRAGRRRPRGARGAGPRVSSALRLEEV